MNMLKTALLSAGIALFLTGSVQALELNIETGNDVSGMKIQSNTVSEGQVVINGKVAHGASRKMTAEEKRQLEQFEQQLERDMEKFENQMEDIFD